MRLLSSDQTGLPQGDKGTLSKQCFPDIPRLPMLQCVGFGKIVTKAVSEESSEITMTREVGGVMEGAPGMSRRPASTNC